MGWEHGQIMEYQAKEPKSQVETRSCLRCRLGAKPGPHPCPCQPGGGVQQVWLEGGHEATIACPSTINSPSTIATPSTIITGEDFHRDRGWSPAPYISLQGNRLCQEGRWWVKQEMASNIFKKMMANVIFDKDTFTNIAEDGYSLIFHS